MADPRHRRPKRRRGVSLMPSSGRRRATGAVDVTDRTPRELHRAARQATSRRAARRILLAGIAALLIVAAAVVASFIVLSSQDEEPRAPAAGQTAEGASAVFVVTGPEGEAASIGVFGSHDEFVSEVILFPPALLATLPGYGESTLGNMTRFGGAELAASTVMNLLGSRIDGAVVVSADQFARAVGAPLEVDLPNPLVVQDGTSQVVVAAEGRASRTQEEMARLLTEQGASDQLAWLVRQGAVWEAVIAAAATDPAIADRLLDGATGDVDSVGEALRGAISDPEHQVVAATVSSVERPGGEVELYDLPAESVEAIASVQLPYLRIGANPRVRVEVLNGNGLVGTTSLVAESLITDGFWVVHTDNADQFTYETSRIIAQGREHQNSALQIQRLLGLGDVEVEQRQPSGVVDVTIIVGGDLPSGSSEGP